MPKKKILSYRAARQEKKNMSEIRANRFFQTVKSLEPAFVVLGDKKVELTDLSKLVPVVGAPLSSVYMGHKSVNKEKKSKTTPRKVIEHTHLSEIKPVFGVIPDEKKKKSKSNNIGDIIKSIIK